jgi:hypothetical protein
MKRGELEVIASALSADAPNALAISGMGLNLDGLPQNSLGSRRTVRLTIIHFFVAPDQTDVKQIADPRPPDHDPVAKERKHLPSNISYKVSPIEAVKP